MKQSKYILQVNTMLSLKATYDELMRNAKVLMVSVEPGKKFQVTNSDIVFVFPFQPYCFPFQGTKIFQYCTCPRD